MNPAADSSSSEQAAVRLTDTQLRELMRLVKGANSVELKLTVPATAHRATIQGLPMDPVEAQPRQVYFFDTPDLKLYKAGVVVRARRRQGGVGDTVVKLRPVEPDDIPQDLKNDAAFNIEVDALPGGFVCSASYKGRSTGQQIRDAVGGKKRLSKIFSKAQRSYFKAHAPEGVDMDSLVPLGPTFILKGRFDTQMGLDGKTVRAMVAEVWLYPDGSRILELSTKCAPADALAVAAEARAYLVDKHVPTFAAQETKTRTALEFYAKALAFEQAEEKAASRRAPAKRSAASSSARPTPAKTVAQPAAKTAGAKTAGAKPAAATRRATKPTATKAAAAKPAASKTQATKRPATKAPAAKPTAATKTSAKTSSTNPATTTRRATAARRPTSSRTAAASRSTGRTTTARRKTSSSGK